MTSELASATEERHALKEDNDRLQDTEQQLAEKARAIKLQLEKKESEAIGLKTVVVSLETSVDNMRQDIIRLRQQYAETTEALHDAQKQAKLLTSERQELLCHGLLALARSVHRVGHVLNLTLR